MKYAEVTMKDHAGNDVEAIGVVSPCGTYVAATIARIGSDKWYENKNGADGSKMRNLAYADTAILGFQVTEDAEEGGFVQGIVGGEIIKSTPLYMKQYQAPNGEIGDPFQNSILDYQYKTGPRGQQERNIITLLGDGIKEMITESINKSFEVLNQKHEAGENIHRRSANAELSRTSNAVLAMVGRDAAKRPASQIIDQQQNTATGETADDILPD